MRSTAELDLIAAGCLRIGRLSVNLGTGEVFAPLSNTPSKPVGCLTSKGYLRICLNWSGGQVHLMAHRVVWIAAHGIPQNPWPIDHLNLIKADNHPENLELVTSIENTERARAAGIYRANGRKDGIRDKKGQFGKKAAGAMLDGREWREMPQAAGGG